MDNNPVYNNDVLGLYSKNKAERMAERGAKNGYSTSVVENPDKDGDFGVKFVAERKEGTYRKTQYEGKFRGIGKSGLSAKKLSKFGFVTPKINAEPVEKVESNSTIQVESKIGQFTQGTITLKTDFISEIKRGNNSRVVTFNDVGEKVSTTNRMPIYGSYTVSSDGSITIGNGLFGIGQTSRGTYSFTFSLFFSTQSNIDITLEWDPKPTVELVSTMVQNMKYYSTTFILPFIYRGYFIP